MNMLMKMSLAVTLAVLVSAKVLAVDVPTGPIWDQADAESKCPNVCAGLVWNGQWTTTEPGVMSVCGTTVGVDMPVGAIWSNVEAQTACPGQLAQVTWSGQWNTTVPGQISVCGCVPPPPLPPGTIPAFNSLDWLTQDVVTSYPNADPVCYGRAQRKELNQWDVSRYLLKDYEQVQGHTSFVVRAWNTEYPQWEDRSMSTFDYGRNDATTDGYTECAWTGSDGGDVYENAGDFVSIVGTKDNASPGGWFSSWGDGCQMLDAWISYRPSSMPSSSGTTINLTSQTSSPIIGISNPTPASMCPGPWSFNMARTSWTNHTGFQYAADSTCGGGGKKTLNTIFSDHDGGDHHEVFYFTDEYGLTRWERWDCQTTPYQSQPTPDYAQLRCNYNDSRSILHMAYGYGPGHWQIYDTINNKYCVIKDCRDWTTFTHDVPAAGWKPATWRMPQMYYSANLIRNGDFATGDASYWVSNGNTVEVVEEQSNQHVAQLTNLFARAGWFYQTVDITEQPLDNFLSLGAGDPKYVHWGIVGSGGTVWMDILLWDSAGNLLATHGENRALGTSDAHFADSLPFDSGTRYITLRFYMAPYNPDTVRIDSAYVVINDQPGDL